MNSLISKFKRNFALAVLLLILLILLWLRFFVAPQVPKEVVTISPSTYPSPPETVLTADSKIIQSPNLPPDIKSVFNYTGVVFSAPSKLPVYTPEEPTKVNLEQATTYAGKFGITSQPVVSETDANNAPFYLWQEENKVFSIGGSFPAISFNDYGFFEHNSSPSAFNESLLIGRAKEEIEKLSIVNVDYNSPTFFYYKTTPSEVTNEVELEPTTNESEASYIGVGLTYKLGNYHVISDAPFNLPIFLVFDTSGRLFEFTAYLFSPSLTTAATPVIPFDQALKQLNQEGIIFSAVSNKDINQKEIPLYNLKSVDLSAVALSYYLPINVTSVISPYYTFKGTAIDEESKNLVDVIVLSPVN